MTGGGGPGDRLKAHILELLAPDMAPRPRPEDAALNGDPLLASLKATLGIEDETA
jgi:hypothetical protein